MSWITTLRLAIRAMYRNLVRTVLTMLGIVCGIARRDRDGVARPRRAAIGARRVHRPRDERAPSLQRFGADERRGRRPGLAAVDHVGGPQGAEQRRDQHDQVGGRGAADARPSRVRGAELADLRRRHDRRLVQDPQLGGGQGLDLRRGLESEQRQAVHPRRDRRGAAVPELRSDRPDRAHPRSAVSGLRRVDEQGCRSDGRHG